MVSLFDQCLTYLHRTEKESIDEWGLPEQITTYLWRNVDRCIGCTRTFVGKVWATSSSHTVTPPLHHSSYSFLVVSTGRE